MAITSRATRPETNGADVDHHHERPHRRLAYRAPREIAASWKQHEDQPANPRGQTDDADGIHQ